MVKTTGIVRRMDELGRIVLPMELRRTLGIEVGDSLEIFVNGMNIILKKYEPACIFCGNVDRIITYRGRNVCKDCIESCISETIREEELLTQEA